MSKNCTITTYKKIFRKCYLSRLHQNYAKPHIVLRNEITFQDEHDFDSVKVWPPLFDFMGVPKCIKVVNKTCTKAYHKPFL